MSETLTDSDYKEVRFDIYCKTCKYKDAPEYESHCFGCLEEPMRYYSEKPVEWVEK